MTIFDFINSISNIRRWSQAHCTKPESVLEHTAFVSMYSYHLCCKHDINPGDALTQALVHDIEEVATGDVPKTTKYHNEDIMFELKKIEDSAARVVSNDVFSSKAYIPWRHAKDCQTESGCIVAIADIAACSYKIWQEVSIGNISFLDYTGNVKEGLVRLRYVVAAKFHDDIDDLIKFTGEIK